MVSTLLVYLHLFVGYTQTFFTDMSAQTWSPLA